MGTWNELSNEITQAVQEAGKSILAVQGRGRTSAGIVLDDSQVLAAAHSVSDEESVNVWISPDHPVRAQLVGRDSATDIAVLKTDEKVGTPPQFSDSPALGIGQLVVAVARTWRGNLVASSGILSGLMGEWHTYRGRKIEAFIRPDLTYYSGFSGGALIGSDRKIIGMNTAALRRGSPLTIPYATIKRITSTLLEKGYVPQPYLGLGLQPVQLPESLKQKLNLTEHAGALVVHVEPSGPADNAGALVGDVLLKINADSFGEQRTASILSRLSPGQTATVSGIRGGQPFSSTIVIDQRPRRRA
jgi:S1-C subfamily serine protease